MCLTKLKLLFLFLILELVVCNRCDWELSQLTQITNNFESNANQSFNSIEDVIKDARIQIKKWMKDKTYNLGAIPGAVFGLSVKSKTIWTEGFGRTDLENNVTTNEKSVWRLASISKPLTTALIGQLIDRQILDLNTSIDAYLSNSVFPRKLFDGKEFNITLRQLLSHTAGLHFTSLDDFNSVFMADSVVPSLKKFKDEKLLFKPGTGFSYSNYGFQVVGAIIESVLNNTFQNEIKKFYTRINMNNTFAEIRSKIFEHRPRYYEPIKNKNDENESNGESHLTNTDLLDDLFSYEGWWPSGGMLSTVDDLLTFGNAMIRAYKGDNKSFLSQSIVRELWTPETKGIHKYQDFGKNEYAKGWLIVDPNELIPNFPYETLVWHSGGLLGTSTLLFLFPEEELVCVAFSNVGGTLLMDQLLLYVAKNLHPFI